MYKSRGSNSKCLFREKDKIKSKKEIRNIIHNGIMKKCHYVDFYFIKNKKSRLAILLRKKENNAVQRNKIKRIIRETFRRTEKQNYDLIVKVKKNIKEIDFKKLEKIFVNIIEK